MFRRWCIPLAGLALVIGSVAASAPAAAAGSPAGHLIRPAIHLIRPGAPAAGHGFRSNAQQTSNWSGYAALNGTFTSVSANWTEPTGHCNSARRFSSFWVGLDGDGSNSVEQTGSEVDCSGGSPVYYSWYEMFPAFPVNFSNFVAPGDHFHGSVTTNGFGNFTLVLRDITQGWSHTIHKSSSTAQDASAEVIAEAPSSNTGVLPLADFGTVHFNSIKVNGSAIGNSSPTKVVMIDNSGLSKDSVSALINGLSFSATWRRAN